LETRHDRSTGGSSPTKPRSGAATQGSVETGYAQNAIIHQGRLDPGVQLTLKPFGFAGLTAKIRHMFDEG
jgi:hypothetical protein